MLCSGIISMVAVHKLIDTGLSTKIYSYPLIVEKVLGKTPRIILEIAIALTQFSFVTSYIVYLIESWSTGMESVFGVKGELYMYAIVVFVIYTLMSWVRDLTKFSFAFILGVVMIMITLFAVVGYGSWLVAEQGGAGPDLQFFNSSGYMNTLGFTIYTYEGIGVVMPIMETTADPSRYKEMVTYAFVAMIVIYTLFPEFCYYAWGSNLDEAIVT